jgi:hypothetical protein
MFYRRLLAIGVAARFFVATSSMISSSLAALSSLSVAALSAILHRCWVVCHCFFVQRRARRILSGTFRVFGEKWTLLTSVFNAWQNLLDIKDCRN